MRKIAIISIYSLLLVGCTDPKPFDAYDGIADYEINYVKTSTPYKIDTTVRGFYSRYITDTSEIKIDVYFEVMVPTETNADKRIEPDMYLVRTRYKDFKHDFKFTLGGMNFMRGFDHEKDFEKHFSKLKKAVVDSTNLTQN